MNSMNASPAVVTPDAPLHTSSAVPLTTDIAVSAAQLVTVIVEGTLLLSSNSPDAGAVIGIVWPYGCTDGVVEIVVDGVRTVGNIGANVTAQPSSHPGAGSSPATVRATFVTGSEPSGSFAVTIASSDGVAEVTMGAGSWIRVWTLG